MAEFSIDQNKLPGVKEGIYFSVCLALMVISLLETVIITNVLHSNSKKYREVPHWVRVVILKHVARMICYQWPKELVKPTASRGSTRDDKADRPDSTSPPWVLAPATPVHTPVQHTTSNIGPGGVSSVPELRQICQDLSDLRAHLTLTQKEDVLQEQWCHVGYVLDFLLFRIYLILISCYAMVIICMWCIWVKQ